MYKRGLLLALPMITLLACGGEEPAPNPPRPVRVQAVRSIDDGTALRYSASLTPKTQVNLSFKVGGYIRDIESVRGADGRMRPIQQGDVVARGTVLARIDEQEYQDRVKRAEASLARSRAAQQKAEADFRRADNLYSTQSITAPAHDRAKKDLESTTASVAESEAQLDEAKLNLGDCALKAPMSGVLLKRNIEVGSLVHDGSVAFVLADVTSVKAVFGVPDVVLSQVEPGNRLAITTASFPGESFDGTVTAVSPSADPSSRVFEVEVTVPNADGKLRDGMVSSLRVEGDGLEQQIAVVPLSAVVRDTQSPDGFAVYVATERDGGTVASLQPVSVGSVYGNDIAITSGLDPGAQIIVSGAKLLSDGEAVEIIP